MTDTEKIKELYKEYWKHMISKDFCGHFILRKEKNEWKLTSSKATTY